MAITLFTPTTFTFGVAPTPTTDIPHNSDASANAIKVTIHGSGLSAIISVTWDLPGANQAFTLIGSRLDNADGRTLAEYFLISPGSSGTKNVRIVMTTADAFDVTIQSMSGVDTGAPTSGFQSFATGGPGDTSPTNLPAVASATGDVVVASCTFANTTAITVGSGQTEDANYNDGLLGAGRAGVSHKDGAASVTMEWTFTGTQDYCILGYSIKAAAGGGGPTSRPLVTFLGATFSQ